MRSIDTMKAMTENKVFSKYINLILLSLGLLSLSACNPKSEAPKLDNAPAQVYTKNVVISVLSFNNAGGEKLTNCSADSLPTGLSVAKSADSKTCEITGTPTAVQAATTHTITASNAAGRDAATVSIEVKATVPPLALPALDNATAQVYDKDVAIATLAFNNSGGKELINCSANSLPTGLSIVKSADSKTCEITGTPTAVQAATTHTITASNAAGRDAATVSIEVKAGVADTIPPKIVSRIPANTLNSRKDVEPDITISVTFDEPMLAQSITSTSFFLQDIARNPVPAILTYDATTKTATLKPNEPLKLWDSYEVILDGALITDLAGNYFNSQRKNRLNFITKKGSWQNGEQVSLLHGVGVPALSKMDGNDNAMLVWGKRIPHPGGGRSNEMWAAHYNTGGWSDAEKIQIDINGVANNTRGHKVTMNQSGNAMAIWAQDGDIWVNRYVNGWEVAQKISGVGTENIIINRIAIDKVGNALAVWIKPEDNQTDGYLWGASYSIATNSWSAPYRVSKRFRNNADRDRNRPLGGDVFSPNVAFDSNGNAIITWGHSYINDFRHGSSVWVNRLSSNGQWSGAQIILASNYDPVKGRYERLRYQPSSPNLQISDADTIWLSWTEYVEDRANNETVKGWTGRLVFDSSLQLFSLTKLLLPSPDFILSANPKIEIDSTGNALAVWLEPEGRGLLIKASRNASNGNWETPKIVQSVASTSGYSDNLRLAMDNSGNAMAIWAQTESGGSSQIWGNRYDRALDQWEAPKRIDTILGSGLALYPSIVIDSTGSPLAVWGEFQGRSSYSKLYYSNTFP